MSVCNLLLPSDTYCIKLHRSARKFLLLWNPRRFYSSPVSFLLSLLLFDLCLFQLETYKNPTQVVMASLQLLMQQDCTGFWPGPRGPPSPHGCAPTSRASAQLRSSGLILQKHLFCVERFCRVSARYFGDQSSLRRAHPPPAATQAVTGSSGLRDASHTGSEGQPEQVCSATLCTSGTLRCGKGLRKAALSFCRFFT